MLVVFRLVNLYSLFVYIEHNGDESPKEDKFNLYPFSVHIVTLNFITNLMHLFN